MKIVLNRIRELRIFSADLKLFVANRYMLMVDAVLQFAFQGSWKVLFTCCALGLLCKHFGGHTIRQISYLQRSHRPIEHRELHYRP